jgi:CCR4-NOT transcriptional regulation complex NOT5 subunit
MAISDSQKVDLLWKKVGFGKVKTDSNDNKKAPNEAISSDFIIKANQIWTNASTIPSTMPSSSASPVTVYTDSTSNTVETTEDGTS